MVDFLNWELTNKLHELGYDGDIFLSIDTDGFISNNKFINPSDSKPAILKSAAFRWFREKYGLCIVIKPIDDKKLELGYTLTKNGLIMGASTTYEKAELTCLKNLIEILKTQIKIK